MKTAILFITAILLGCTSTKRVIDASTSSDVQTQLQTGYRDTTSIDREERRDVVTIVETETTTTQYGETREAASVAASATPPVREIVTNCHRLITVDRSVISELTRAASIDTTAAANRYASNETSNVSESVKPASASVWRLFGGPVLLVVLCLIVWIYRKTIIKYLLR